MENLMEILKRETETLKIQYVEKSKNWAITSFENMKKSDFLYLHTSGKYFQNRYGKTKSEDAMICRVVNTINRGIDSYISNIEKEALQHYEVSIMKLVARIEDKGLNKENLKIVTSHVGVNIETTLTDGNKVVRAFTIIAEGEIQRPHYRYLVK